MDRKFGTEANLKEIKTITSKFFIPAPPTPSIVIPPKKPVVKKTQPQLQQTYRSRVICSQEVSRKKIKLDKKAVTVSRADAAAADAAESDEEFFEKIRQKYEKDKSLGLFGESQKKNVKKVKKLFSDECVQLMDKFKKACQDPGSRDFKSTQIHDFNFSQNSRPIETPDDNFLTENNYPRSLIFNNNNYPDSLRLLESENIPLQTPSLSSLSKNQKFMSFFEKDDPILSSKNDLKTISLRDQLSSLSNLNSPILTIRTPSNWSKCSSPEFSVDDSKNKLINPMSSYIPSPPRSNSFNINNSQNFNQGSVVGSKFYLPDYIFKK